MSDNEEKKGSQLCNLRQQTAFADSNTPLFVVIEETRDNIVYKKYYRVKAVWIDTKDAVAGQGVAAQHQTWLP